MMSCVSPKICSQAWFLKGIEWARFYPKEINIFGERRAVGRGHTSKSFAF